MSARSNRCIPGTIRISSSIVCNIILCIVIAVVHLQSCTGDNSAPQSEVTDYTILKTELNTERVFNLTVRVEKPLSDTELIDVAERVVAQIKPKSEVGVVFFLQPPMVVDNGAWAAVDFKPKPQIRFIKQSVDDKYDIKKGIDGITDYLGLWEYPGFDGDVVLRIRRDSTDGFVFEYVSISDPKPSEIPAPLTRSTRKGKTIYIETDRPEQYFRVERNGDLSVFDNFGFVETYRMLRLKKDIYIASSQNE